MKPALFSREADKLRIPRYAICTNIILLESILHVDASRLVKVYTSPLHDAHDLLLARIIEALSRVAGFDISREVECRR
jgi:hypothetical protein